MHRNSLPLQKKANWAGAKKENIQISQPLPPALYLILPFPSFLPTQKGSHPCSDPAILLMGNKIKFALQNTENP